MVMMLFRLARGLAWSRQPEHRWRQLVVPISALLFMLLVVISTSVVAMVDRQAEREAAIQPVISSSASPTDLFLKETGDYWRGHQMLVRWIAPADPDASPVLPPGMDRFPAPGQSVVSPELDRLADHHPILAARYPNRLVLDLDSMVSAGELLAYVRPPADRQIGGEARAVHIDDERYVGDSSVRRVSGFGGQGLDESSDVLPLPWVVLAMLGFVATPGLVMLAVGLAAGSRLRDHRFQMLEALGSPRRTIVGLAVMETLLLALPALAIGTAGWGAIAPRLHTVPLTGYRLVPSDLALPWWLLGIELGLAAGVCGLAAAAVVAWKRRGQTQVRPVIERTRPSKLAAVPLAVAVIAFVAARFVGWELQVTLNVVAIAVAVVGIPLAVPGMLQGAGTWLSRRGSPSVHLAGASLVWDPKRVSRPFIGVSALLLILVVATSQIAIARYVEYPSYPAAAANVVAVEWQDTQSGDLARFSRAVGSGLVVPLVSDARNDERQPSLEGNRVLPPETGSSAITLGTTCAAVAPFLEAQGCDPAHPMERPSDMATELSAVLSPVAQAPQTDIELAPVGQLSQTGRLVVIDRSPIQTLDELVRVAAMTTIPAPHTTSLVRQFQARDSRWGWIFAGIAVAIATLGIGCAMSVVDRALAMRRRHRHLLTLGMSARQMTRLSGALFAVPYTIAAAIGFLIGFVMCLTWLYPDIPMPWTELGIIVVATAGVAALGTVGVAVIGTRATIHTPE